MKTVEDPLLDQSHQELTSGGIARYERPTERIRRFVTGYHFYSEPGGQARTNWFLPGTANIRIAWDHGPIAVTIRDRTFAPLPPLSLFGPTNHAMKAETTGGHMVGIGISALGWARLFAQSAQSVADTIVPLDTLWGAGDVDDLRRLLHRHDPATPLAPLLDDFLAKRLKTPSRDEPLIAGFSRLLIEENPEDVGAIASALGIDDTRLRRLAYRYFGFTPKRLLRRSRFLRSLIAVMERADDPTIVTIGDAYFDQSHFIREAHAYLGMTPGQFMALDKPFLSASLSVRPRVLGAATQALQAIGAAPKKDGART